MNIASNEDVFVYHPSKIGRITRDVRRRKLRRISIVPLSEYANIIEWSPAFSRQIWTSKKALLAFGIVADEDKGDIFKDLIDAIKKMLYDPNMTTKIKPFLNIMDNEERCTLSFRSNRDEIPFWTLKIPKSLEIQVANMYRTIFTELEVISDEDDVIKNVRKLIGKTTEGVIRESVELFAGAHASESWFTNFCYNLKCNIDWC